MMKQAAQQALEALLALHAEGARAGWHLQPKWEAQMRAASCGINALRAAIQQAESEPVRPDILEKLTYHQFERDDLSLDDCLDYLASGWTTVHGRTDRQMVMQILALLARQRIHPAPGVPAADAEWRDVIQGAIDALPYQHHLIPRLVALLSANRPAPGVPDALKDHQIAAMVNTLRDIARQFHGHDSLRERIANVLVPALKAEANADEPVAWIRRHPNGALSNELLIHVQVEQVRRDSGAWVPLYTHPAPGVPDDAKRLNWLDDTNKRFRMGWEVGQAPAGNVSIRTIITGGKSIRDAIDAAMLTAARAQKGGAA